MKSSSRFKPLLPDDAAVGLRLGELRRWLDLTQDEMAKRLAITRDQLSNLEARRVPVKFEFGWELCKQLDVSQLWLATGDYPNKPFLKVDPTLGGTFEISKQATFSSVCRHGAMRSRLDSAFVERQKNIIDLPLKNAVPADNDYDQNQRDLALKSLSLYLAKLPSWKRKLELQEIAGQLGSAFGDTVWYAPFQVIKEDSQKDLTQADTSVKTGSVKTKLRSWSDLKQAVLSHLKVRQVSQADLARKLVVSRQLLNAWLSDRKDAPKPTADATFKLLNWCDDYSGHARESARPGKDSQ